jgi:hypothetical protein
MDRISALRNVEDALREFEDGEADLATTEQRVVAVLRTYATDFEVGDGRAAFRVHHLGRDDDRASDPGHGSGSGSGADETVVVADSPAAAREAGADRLDVPLSAVEAERL